MKKMPFAMLALLGTSLLILILGGCPQELAGGSGGGKSGGPAINPAAATKGGVALAKVGPVSLSVEEMTDRINKQSPFVRARFSDVEKKKEFIENQIRFEALALEAFERGYHNDPEVQASLKKIVVQKLTREEFDTRVKLSDITEADMKGYFGENQDEYNKPEMVRTSHIYVPFGADKNAARAKATEAHKAAADPGRLADRAHFKDLVDKFSADESTKRTGGDLRYLSKPELTERFGAPATDTIWALGDLNAVSGVVEGKDGFHVFKKTGHRKAITRTFEQVQNQIRNRLYRDKRMEAFNAFVDELKGKFGTTLDESKLDQVKVKTDDAQKPGGGAPGAPGMPGMPGQHGPDDGHGHGAPNTQRPGMPSGHP
jgi:peptidyl-prolyl cis-trans isomerase C